MFNIAIAKQITRGTVGNSVVRYNKTKLIYQKYFNSYIKIAT